jgi:integrase/recombinase XerD
MDATRTTPLRERMRQELQLAGLSERTQEAYLRAVRQLATHFGKPPDQVTEPELRQYLLFLKNEKHFASASLKIAFYGIRFFFRTTAPRDWPTFQQLRIPRQKTLPDVLTIDEVRRLIDAVRTPHNRTYLEATGAPRSGTWHPTSSVSPSVTTASDPATTGTSPSPTAGAGRGGSAP